MRDAERNNMRSPKGGRPKLQATDKRNDTIRLRVTTAEKAAYHAKAAAAGRTMSEWFRDLGDGYNPRPPATAVDMAFVQELNRIGVNLNQITRSINRGRDIDDDVWSGLASELRTVLVKAAEKL